jgi:glycosyltransferase involved in cell wall biosynthesis
MNDSLSIFMPFYNDAGTVDYMISQAYLYGQRLTTDLEVVAINDGSTDDTLQELERLKATYPDLKIITHQNNKGYGGALISGIENATKNWVFYTDGDAQYHLDDLEALWPAKNGYDVVNGYKISRSDKKFRKLAGFLYSSFIRRIFKTPINDIDCDYRLMNGDMLRSLDLSCNSGAITIELIKKLQLKGAKFTEVPVHHYNRTYGKSAFFTIANILKTFNDELKLINKLKNTETK